MNNKIKFGNGYISVVKSNGKINSIGDIRHMPRTQPSFGSTLAKLDRMAKQTLARHNKGQ